MVNFILRNFIKLSIPRERKLFIDIIRAQDHLLKQKSRPTVPLNVTYFYRLLRESALSGVAVDAKNLLHNNAWAMQRG
jgi:hypothetical protein